MISDVSDTQQLTACSHDVCECTMMGPTAGASYCSDYCRQTEEDAIEGEACGCGHPPCDAPQ